MALQFVLGQNLLGPKGSDGNTIIGVRGPPDGTVGKLGDYAYDVTNVVFYGPKTSSTTWPTGISLVGPKGASTPQTLPQDFVANSFIAAPQSGDTAAVQFALKNSAGTQVFTVDAQGNISTTGTLSVSGAASTGALTAASAAITGNETVGGNLTVAGTSTVGTLQATNLNVSGNETVGGNLTVQGQTTLQATSTGALTATSLTSTGTTQSTGHIVTSNGTAAAPAFSFLSQPDTGLYLVTASATAAVLGLSVNGVQAFGLTKAGLTLPGTLSVSGAVTLASSLGVTGAITGASTLAITGAISGGASLTVVGVAKAAGVVVTNQGNVADSPNITPAIVFAGAFGGTSSYPPSGITSDSLGNLIFTYQGRSVIAMANQGYSAQVGNAPTTAFGINFTAGAYTFAAGGATALLVGGNGSTTIGGGLSGNSFPCIITQQSGTILSLRQGTNVVGTFDTAGNGTLSSTMTAAGFTLSAAGTKLTFGDGSVQTTAYTTFAANNQAKWIATTQGTTALPAFTFTTNTDTGMYLKGTGTPGALLALTANATDALLMSSSGVNVPGTLSVTGATTVAALTASSPVKATAFTITATGGALTFADGTTQTTAATAGTAGSSTQFVASSNGTVSAPAFTFSQASGTGVYLQSATSTNPTLGISAGSTLAVSVTKTGTIFAQPAGFNAQLTANANIVASSGVNFVGASNTQVLAGAGTAAAPSFGNVANNNTGLFFGTGTGTGSNVFVTVNGTQTANFSNTSLALQNNLIVTGSASASSASISNGVTAGSVTSNSGMTAVLYTPTSSAGSATAVQYGFPGQTFGYWINGSSSTMGWSVNGANVLTGSSVGIQVPLASTFTGVTTHNGAVNCASTLSVTGTQTFSGATTHAATVTSTTPAGTPSFVSSQGFVTSAYGGGYACSATAAPTTPQGLYTTITFPDGTSPQVVGRSYINERGAGSVVGFHFYLQNALTTACQVRMNVNGTNTPYVTIAAGSTTASVSYAKGAYPIPNNGYCYMMVMFGSASTGSIPQLQGGFTLELPA